MIGTPQPQPQPQVKLPYLWVETLRPTFGRLSKGYPSFEEYLNAHITWVEEEQTAYPITEVGKAMLATL